jgi:hypothetical protein
VQLAVMEARIRSSGRAAGHRDHLFVAAFHHVFLGM